MKKEEGISSFANRIQTLFSKRTQSVREIVDPGAAGDSGSVESSGKISHPAEEDWSSASRPGSNLSDQGDARERTASSANATTDRREPGSSVPILVLRTKCMCGKPTDTQCSGCGSTYYCSEACQQRDWPTHEAICGVQREVQVSPSVPPSGTLGYQRSGPHSDVAPGRDPAHGAARRPLSSKSERSEDSSSDQVMLVQLHGHFSDVSDDEGGRDAPPTDIPSGWQAPRKGAPQSARSTTSPSARKSAPPPPNVPADRGYAGRGYDQHYRRRGSYGDDAYQRPTTQRYDSYQGTREPAREPTREPAREPSRIPDRGPPPPRQEWPQYGRR